MLPHMPRARLDGRRSPSSLLSMLGAHRTSTSLLPPGLLSITAAVKREPRYQQSSPAQAVPTWWPFPLPAKGKHLFPRDFSVQITPDPAAAAGERCPGDHAATAAGCWFTQPQRRDQWGKGGLFCCSAPCVCPKEQNLHPKKGNGSPAQQCDVPGCGRPSRRAHNAHRSHWGDKPMLRVTRSGSHGSAKR